VRRPVARAATVETPWIDNCLSVLLRGLLSGDLGLKLLGLTSAFVATHWQHICNTLATH
jgi:hypothetical protein